MMTALAVAAPVLSLNLPPLAGAVGCFVFGLGVAFVAVAVVWQVRSRKEKE